MITQKDIKELEKTFATKKDLNKLEKDFSKIFATKKDLENLSDNILEAIYAMGNMILKDTKNDINTHDDTLENHDRRIIKLEDKAFS